jgi:hypothetical protein
VPSLLDRRNDTTESVCAFIALNIPEKCRDRPQERQMPASTEKDERRGVDDTHLSHRRLTGLGFLYQ